jgi:dTDP-4-amino-4,6-dideoxygalactose transaminase
MIKTSSVRTTTLAPIPFIDVAAQRRRLGARIDAAIARVLAHCQFIMGPEVGALETELRAFCGARHALGCASGTDALLLALMAKGIGPGDAVICPSFTFCATAETAALVGATPVFVDVEEATFNIEPASLERAVAAAGRLGLKPKAVIAVDMFGLPADYDAIASRAAAHGLFVIADAAQSFGAAYRGRRVGALAPVTTTSFFPSKPLSCYGDGGAVFTDDDALADAMRSLRIHGQGADKYDNVRIGINGRLDTVQAAVLIEKLKIFAEEMLARDRIARRYGEGLGDVAIVPRVPDGATTVWAIYTIRLAPGVRDGVMTALAAQGIPTAVYYPKPVHRQVAYRHYPVAGNGLPVTDRLAAEVLSLPMHAYLDEPTQDRIIAAVRGALGR